MGNWCAACFKDSSTDLQEKFLDGKSDTSSLTSLPRKAAKEAHSGFRAFILVNHSVHGLLLLEAHKKRKGGRHFQLPGGHVDAHELSYGPDSARIAAARELWEETGMDFRDRLYRLTPIDMESLGVRGKALHESGRRYFSLEISQTDSVDDIPPQATGSSPGPLLRLATPLSMENFRLCLSPEHTGFRFHKSMRKAAEDLSKHSGGSSSEAVMLLYARDSSTHSAHSAEGEKGAGAG
eukprot:CAMPEP_0181311890 /NCGR_PEP_ID=MMETSP1101-20121128/13394_1 /TAXON_ID=46948 /ORGANISM="Rhodomonas abbreviata, Strain Caron Lab Isolate" /LENGTH=236 /DNA_ID=CAMNT_0023418683 /DNA_START=348 /DNA_END=1055 /DNA_ORIENTATION=-